MSAFDAPTVAWHGAADPSAPLVVLLHGRGSKEADIIGLADHLPAGPAYAAVRAPIGEGGGYAWFANRGIGRPVAESLRETMDWFRAWLDQTASTSRPVVLIGFSGGAAFAGGLVLDDPDRYAGAAVLYGTLPFDAGVPTTPGRLAARSSSAALRRSSTRSSGSTSCSATTGSWPRSDSAACPSPTPRAPSSCSRPRSSPSSVGRPAPTLRPG